MEAIRELDRTSKIAIVMTLLVLCLTPFGIHMMLSGEGEAVTPVVGAKGAGDDGRDVSRKSVVPIYETGSPALSLSYISFDNDSLDVYFTQRNIDKVSVDVIAKDPSDAVIVVDGKEAKGSLTYHRGDTNLGLSVSLPMDNENYSKVNSLTVLVDGAEFDDSTLEDLLGEAKRSRALILEDERLREIAKNRADHKAAREAEEAEQRAIEAERKAQEEAKRKAAEAAANAPQNESSRVEGWVWGDSYLDMVIDCAKTYGSSTGQFIVNDLESRKLTVLEMRGSDWTPVAWFDVNQNGLSSGTTLSGLYTIVERAPSDYNGAYHVDGIGLDDWMLAYHSQIVPEDIITGGYHLRRMGDGYWLAQGFCHGFDKAWYGGGTDGDGNIYLEEDAAKWLYDNIATGTSVLNV